MDLKSWQVGDVTITRIQDAPVVPMDPEILYKELSKEKVSSVDRLQPHFATGDGQIILAFQAFAVQAEEKKILVDTCIGNDKDRNNNPVMHKIKTSFLDDLRKIGFAPESVDTILFTHLHADHVGWNTVLVDGQWVPTFPNARYLFGRVEWERCSREPVDAFFGDVVGDSLKPVVEAGLCDLVETSYRLSEEIWLEPTPGHTSGHASVRIASKGEEAMITGDWIHNPIECVHPELPGNFCSDLKLSRAMREKELARCASSGTLIIGSHFGGPTAGWIRADGPSYRFSSTEKPKKAG